MRVGLDAHMVGHGETGNENYVANLLLALDRCPRDEVVAYLRRPSDWPTSTPPRHVQVRRLRPPHDSTRLAFGLALAARTDRLDVLHVTYHAPLWTPCPFVVTVHDLSFKRFPQFFRPRDRLLFRLLMPTSLRRAALILTGSENTRRDLVEFFPETRGKVVVTAYAAGEEFRPIQDPQLLAGFCQRNGIDPPFFLALGSINPRKNLRRLIQAWDRAQSACSLGTLVIAGPSGFHHEQVLRMAQSVMDPRRIRFIGQIAARDLPLAYNAAQALIYPSLYEGFGLPVLEAMACGTPVLASNVSSIPEVAGEAGWLFDPTNVDAMAEALIRISKEPEFARELGARGLRRAAQFSWTRTAEMTWQAYAMTMKSE